MSCLLKTDYAKISGHRGSIGQDIEQVQKTPDRAEVKSDLTDKLWMTRPLARSLWGTFANNLAARLGRIGGVLSAIFNQLSIGSALSV